MLIFNNQYSHNVILYLKTEKQLIVSDVIIELMKLPNSDKVIISRKKLTDYVLSETHSTGKFKAKFFRTLGFNDTNVSFFEIVLRTLVDSEDIKETIPSVYGTKYILDGKVNTPSGKNITLRTIWIIEKGQSRPRFITVYPV